MFLAPVPCRASLPRTLQVAGVHGPITKNLHRSLPCKLFFSNFALKMPKNPEKPLSAEELAACEADILGHKKTLAERFAMLTELRERLGAGLSESRTFERLAGMHAIRSEYLLNTSRWEEELSALKTQFRQLDSRIVAAEQKMSRGIPDDLKVMEKLIFEQESIVAEQEKLNLAESELAARLRALDMEYGRQEEKHSARFRNDGPDGAGDAHWRQHYPARQKKIALRSKLLSIAAVLVFPLILDYLLKGTAFPLREPAHWIAKGHPAFLALLILTEFFAGSWIRQRITALAAGPFLREELVQMRLDLEEIHARIRSTEKNSGMAMGDLPDPAGTS